MSVCFCQLHHFVSQKNAVFVFCTLIVLRYLERWSTMISQNIITYLSDYSSAPILMCNMFQDLPQLHETADNTEINI
jgi:hypothetical protein